MHIQAVENIQGFKKLLQVKENRTFQPVTLHVQQQLTISLFTRVQWIGLCLLFCENPGLLQDLCSLSSFTWVKRNLTLTQVSSLDMAKPLSILFLASNEDKANPKQASVSKGLFHH